MKFKRGRFKNFTSLDMGLSLGKDLGKIDFGDSFASLMHPWKDLYLGRFTVDDLMSIMKKVGMVEYLHKKGFRNLNISIDRDDAMVHYMKLYSGKQLPANMLMDLRLSETRFTPDRKFFPKGLTLPTYDMVVIEWLSAQNSSRDDFDDGKPQLPGQVKPGLGILKYCFDMMYTVAREVTRDGFMDIPEHLHGAIMYSRKFKFFDPEYEAILRAIMRDMKKYSLSDISWGMITGTIIDANSDTPLVFDPSEQIFYVSSRMRGYFNSDAYKSHFNSSLKKKKFILDYTEMQKRKEEILKKKTISEL